MAVTNYELLENFNENIGADYEDFIPELTRANITTVGNAIIDYSPTKNKFYDTLINKIGMTKIRTKFGGNKFAQFKGADMKIGDTLEDIYADKISAITFDENDENPYKQSKPPVKVLYHKLDRDVQYPLTIKDYQMRQAFNSENGVSQLVNIQLDSVYSSNEDDEFTQFKEMLKSNYKNATKPHQKVVIKGGDDYEKATSLLKALKKTSEDLTFNSNKYNKIGCRTKTNIENQVIVIHKDYKQAIDFDVLSGLFNVDKAELNSKIYTVDNFNNDTNKIIACIFDKDSIEWHNNLFYMSSQRNEKGRYTNYWLNVAGFMSMSLFSNLVYFTEE